MSWDAVVGGRRSIVSYATSISHCANLIADLWDLGINHLKPLHHGHCRHRGTCSACGSKLPLTKGEAQVDELSELRCRNCLENLQAYGLNLSPFF